MDDWINGLMDILIDKWYFDTIHGTETTQKKNHCNHLHFSQPHKVSYNQSRTRSVHQVYSSSCNESENDCVSPLWCRPTFRLGCGMFFSILMVLAFVTIIDKNSTTLVFFVCSPRCLFLLSCSLMQYLLLFYFLLVSARNTPPFHAHQFQVRLSIRIIKSIICK